MSGKNQSIKSQITFADLLKYLQRLEQKIEQFGQTIGAKIDAMHRDLKGDLKSLSRAVDKNADHSSFVSLGAKLEMIYLELEVIREKLKAKSAQSEIKDSIINQPGRKPLH